MPRRHCCTATARARPPSRWWPSTCARCGVDLDAAGRARLAGVSYPTCVVGAALVDGGDARLLPRSEQPRLRSSYPSLLPADAANAGVLQRPRRRACCPIAGCPTFADLLARAEAERGSLAGDDRFLLVRGGTDPAILPLECRYLVCDGALIVIGPDGAGGRTGLGGRGMLDARKGRERRALPALVVPCYICIMRIELPDESRKPASRP